MDVKKELSGYTTEELRDLLRHKSRQIGTLGQIAVLAELMKRDDFDDILRQEINTLNNMFKK